MCGTQVWPSAPQITKVRALPIKKEGAAVLKLYTINAHTTTRTTPLHTALAVHTRVRGAGGPLPTPTHQPRTTRGRHVHAVHHHARSQGLTVDQGLRPQRRGERAQGSQYSEPTRPPRRRQEFVVTQEPHPRG